MPDMADYVVAGFTYTGRALKEVENVLRYQRRMNRKLARNIALLSFTAAAYIYVQNKKIEKLSREIKALKGVEGDKEM